MICQRQMIGGINHFSLVKKMSKASQFVQTGKKIICVLRNYAQHAKEMKSVIPTSPQFFLKPTTSYLPNNGTIRIPKGLKEIHHEGSL